MNPQRIDWRSISEPNLYGWEATIGDRRAQVVRAYTSDWRVFAWIDGRTCKEWEPADKPGHPNASAARKQAGQFLRGEFTPETWPDRLTLTQLRKDLSDIQEDLHTRLAETPVTSDASPIIAVLGAIIVALGPNSKADDTELRNVLDSARRAMEGNGNA